jgi:hypothetical protein
VLVVASLEKIRTKFFRCQIRHLSHIAKPNNNQARCFRFCNIGDDL